MAKFRFILFSMLSIFCMLLTACSSQEESSKSSKVAYDQATSSDSGKASKNESVSINEEENINEKSVEAKLPDHDRKVIYTADLQLKVDNFENSLRKMEEKSKKYGGYVVESNVYREGEEQLSGTMTVRIPEAHFQAFLHDAEGVAVDVIERRVSGQDVTEEYIDLESRLKSKRVVEERLLDFMKKAQKTEDLLKISSDLAVVQEEIEQIEGRMKYLNNQTSFSTVSITMFENRIVVPDKEDLNTWERTQKQFAKSMNTLMLIISGGFVFVVGNIPFIIILVIIIAGILVMRKRLKNKQDKNDSSNSL